MGRHRINQRKESQIKKELWKLKNKKEKKKKK